MAVPESTIRPAVISVSISAKQNGQLAAFAPLWLLQLWTWQFSRRESARRVSNLNPSLLNYYSTVSIFVLRQSPLKWKIKTVESPS